MRRIHRILDEYERSKNNVIIKALGDCISSEGRGGYRFRTYIQHFGYDSGDSCVFQIVGFRHLALIRLVEGIRMKHDKAKGENVWNV